MVKSALVIGASRGIGRQIAVTLAKNGYQVGVAAKTVISNGKTPGTIYDVCHEISKNGGKAVPVPCNVRNDNDVKNAVNTCLRSFSALDCVVYNAGAIMWENVKDTPMKRFDLMHEVNDRGAYCLIQNVLPHMLDKKFGRIVLVSPPIYSRFFKGKTPYSMTKVGMTVLTHGLANEIANSGVTISSLWPATVIKSQVTTVKRVPNEYMRKATIFADACLGILSEPSDKLNGRALIDEDYLREEGVTDFTAYRCDPHEEPPRMMPKTFPVLTVEEEDARLNLFNSKL